MPRISSAVPPDHGQYQHLLWSQFSSQSGSLKSHLLRSETKEGWSHEKERKGGRGKQAVKDYSESSTSKIHLLLGTVQNSFLTHLSKLLAAPAKTSTPLFPWIANIFNKQNGKSHNSIYFSLSLPPKHHRNSVSKQTRQVFLFALFLYILIIFKRKLGRLWTNMSRSLKLGSLFSSTFVLLISKDPQIIPSEWVGFPNWQMRMTKV